MAISEKPLPDVVLRSTRYESTVPVAALQLRLICVDETAVAVNPEGALGDAGNVVAVTCAVYAEQPPALQARIR